MSQHGTQGDSARSGLPFHQRLQRARRARGWSQKELADRLDVFAKTVARWERGESYPQPQYLQKIATLFPGSNYPLLLEPVEAETREAKSSLEVSPIHIRILEEPLTAQNLLTIISALTELSTKYWLIAKGRFADLIEYTQTHNGRFAEEANIVVTRITYNSPMNMDWKVDLSAPSVAEALVTTIDGITQVRKRLEQVELENRAKAQEIKHTEQQADHEQQMAVLEREQRRLEVEQRRLELLEKQLEVQKKGIEYALEIAGKVVDTLHPGADSATRAMEIQALLPNLIQLQNGKGLELAIATQSRSEEKDSHSGKE
jgi:transcriptional regulator with XRE-family HTH domain